MMRRSVLLLVLFSCASASAADHLTHFEKCHGINQYNERITVDLYVGKRKHNSNKIKSKLILTEQHNPQKTLINGLITAYSDLKGDLMFISHDDRYRFVTSGVIYSLDYYRFRVNKMICKFYNKR